MLRYMLVFCALMPLLCVCRDSPESLDDAFRHADQAGQSATAAHQEARHVSRLRDIDRMRQQADVTALQSQLSTSRGLIRGLALALLAAALWLAQVELAGARGRFRGRVILPLRAVALAQKLIDPKMGESLRLIVQPLVAVVADSGEGNAAHASSNGDGPANAADNGEEASSRKKKKQESSPETIILQSANWRLTALVGEGHFPKYSDVIPEPGSRFVVDRRVLIEVVKQVALGSGDLHRTLHLELSDTLLRISSESPEVGRSEALVECHFDGGGDSEIHTGFNPTFLLDALQTLEGSHIVIDVQQNTLSTCGEQVCGRPALFYSRENPGARWLVMPVSLGLPPSRASLGSNYIEPEVAHAS